MKQGTVTLIIYFYIFVCLVFLLFNILYVFYDKYVEKRNRKYVREYDIRIRKAAENHDYSHDRFIRKELRTFYCLCAYYEALKNNEDILNRYLVSYRDSITDLFVYYIDKDSMEKAFTANMVSELFGDVKESYPELPMIMIRYLKDSTVYVRENVLKALCVLGSERGIEIFYHTLNEKGIMHHSKLLSDGLNEFTGDRKNLALKLFENYSVYDDDLNVSVINFMANIGDCFKDELLGVFDSSSLECRHAIMRYFRKYPDAGFEDRLLEILAEDGNLSITAASSLAAYPDEKVKSALKKSVSSSNWYIRKNSAMSLLEIGLNETEINELKNNEDRYASEIFNYVLERRGG